MAAADFDVGNACMEPRAVISLNEYTPPAFEFSVNVQFMSFSRR